MKVIDLLNKIANNEELPKKIKCHWKYEWQYDETREEYTYMQETGERFDDDWLIISKLNDEVEVIEEDKKIKKIQLTDANRQYLCSTLELQLIDVINEIIDYLNSEDR